MPEPQYAVGNECTWYGPLIEAVSNAEIDERPQCPVCGGVCAIRPIEEFERLLRTAEASGFGVYVDATHWGKRRCYPTMDDLAAAYLQVTPQSR